MKERTKDQRTTKLLEIKVDECRQTIKFFSFSPIFFLYTSWYTQENIFVNQEKTGRKCWKCDTSIICVNKDIVENVLLYL